MCVGVFVWSCFSVCAVGRLRDDLSVQTGVWGILFKPSARVVFKLKARFCFTCIIVTVFRSYT